MMRATVRLRNHLVRGNHIPGCVLGAAARERLLVRGDVVVPVLALRVVGLADLPLLGRVFEALPEARELLFLRDVQEELEDARVVLGEALLESVDALVAARPDLLRHQVMHPHDQHVLVVGAVEDRDLAARRRAPVHAPQEVVRGLLRRGLPEWDHPASLRIHRGEDVVDRPVLAAGVHRLEAHEEGMAPLGVEQVLKRAQPLLAALDLLERLLVLLVAVLEAGVEVLERELASGLHAEPIEIAHFGPQISSPGVGAKDSSARACGTSPTLLGVVPPDTNSHKGSPGAALWRRSPFDRDHLPAAAPSDHWAWFPDGR